MPVAEDPCYDASHPFFAMPQFLIMGSHSFISFSPCFIYLLHFIMYTRFTTCNTMIWILMLTRTAKQQHGIAKQVTALKREPASVIDVDILGVLVVCNDAGTRGLFGSSSVLLVARVTPAHQAFHSKCTADTS